MKHIILSFLITIIGCLSIEASDEPIKREMRGTWIASIYGLDWPKMSGTDAATVNQQKASLDKMLDQLKAAGMNAVMFQVRTFCDALYKSELEPWAVALTGKRGTAQAVDWDPLAYCVEQAHARGMECHAWVNPFRYATSATPYTDKFDKEMRPMLITFTERPKTKREKAKTTVILDPGNKKAREHVVKVCKDIISRYDVDGLIFDDYFYPDRLPLGGKYDFDEWKKSGTKLSQADWRRDNVNRTVQAVYKMIQETKPYVAFGISPAGVGGGNGVSSSRYGLEKSPGSDWMYDRIFCDPLAWMAEGHVDYVSPQIYWNHDHKTNPYGSLAKWWSQAADKLNRHFYASHSLSSFASKGGDTATAWKERGAQIETNRRHSVHESPGSIMYAARNINGFGKHLAANQYSSPALTPVFKWKESHDPGKVKKLRLNKNILEWQPVDKLCRYTIYAIPEDISLLDAMSVDHGGISAEYLLGVSYSPKFTIPADKQKGYRFAVVPYDRYGYEWEAEITD